VEGSQATRGEEDKRGFKTVYELVQPPKCVQKRGKGGNQKKWGGKKRPGRGEGASHSGN